MSGNFKVGDIVKFLGPHDSDLHILRYGGLRSGDITIITSLESEYGVYTPYNIWVKCPQANPFQLNSCIINLSEHHFKKLIENEL